MCGASPCDKPGCTWKEAFRATCEAKTVVEWPKLKRDRYYQEVKARRGEEAARKLIEGVREAWKNKQSNL